MLLVNLNRSLTGQLVPHCKLTQPKVAQACPGRFFCAAFLLPPQIRCAPDTQISSWVTRLTDSVCTETNLIFAWGHIFTNY
jgi:hypothetical protein